MRRTLLPPFPSASVIGGERRRRTGSPQMSLGRTQTYTHDFQVIRSKRERDKNGKVEVIVPQSWSMTGCPRQGPHGRKINTRTKLKRNPHARHTPHQTGRSPEAKQNPQGNKVETMHSLLREKDNKKKKWRLLSYSTLNSSPANRAESLTLTLGRAPPQQHCRPSELGNYPRAVWGA